MGTTAEKGAYTIETKSLLKQAINNLGGSITDETTFRQYVNQLDGVYDVLPKTEFQEGTEVTIENGLKGKIDFDTDNGKKIVGYGDTEQESTNGYQLLSSEKANQSSSLSVTYISGVRYNCKTTSSGNQLIFKGIGLPSGNYVVSIQVTRGTYSGRNFVVRNSSNSVIGEGAINGTNRLNITISNNDINSLLLWGASANLDFDFDIQISSGTTEKDFEPYTGGYASPSPNWEQEVKCVSGRNKFDISTQKTGKVYNRYNKTWDNSGEWNSSDYIKVNQNSSYVLSFGSFDSGMQVYVTYLENDKDYISGGTPTTITNLFVPITTPLNCEYIVFGYYNNKNATNIMLEQGSTAHPYLPYNTIQETIRGKNLFDTSIAQIGSNYHNTFVDNGGSLSVTATGTYSYRTYYISGLKIGESYTVSFKGYKDENATLGTVRIGIGTTATSDYGYRNMTTTSTDYSLTFIATDEIVHVCLYPVLTDYISGGTISLENIQIEQGSTATSYEPYVTPRTYQFSLGNNKFYKIGDYADELLYDVDEDKVYKLEKIRKIVLNGVNQYYWKNSNDSNNYLYYTNIGTKSGNGVLANKLLTKTLSTINSGNGIDKVGMAENGTVFYFNVGYYITENTVDVVKTWLQSNNIDLFYVLNEADYTLTELTDTTLHQQVKNWYYSQSFNGTTIIESNGDLPMIIKVRALKGES